MKTIFFVVPFLMLTVLSSQAMMREEHPIFKAAREQNKYIFDKLMKNGADINMIDEAQRTPLHWAVFGTDIGFIQHLLNIGANINAQDEIGQTPLSLAITDSDPNILRVLLSHKEIDIDKPNEDGRTPLHFAVIENKLEAFRLLREANANYCITDKYKKSPMHYALSSSNKEFIRLIISKLLDN